MIREFQRKDAEIYEYRDVCIEGGSAYVKTENLNCGQNKKAGFARKQIRPFLGE